MKTITVLLMMFTTVPVVVFCQNLAPAKIPPVIKAALAKKYPMAKNITWEKEKGNFEANWGGKSGEDMSVQFSPAGVFVEQVVAISPAILPESIIRFVMAHYKGAKITEAGRVTDAAGTLKYEAEVKGKDLLFSESGAYLKSN